MRSVAQVAKRCIIGSLLEIASICVASHPTTLAGQKTIAPIHADSSAGHQVSEFDVFSGLAARQGWKKTHLDRLSVVRTYKVKNRKSNVLAEETVAVDYRAPRTEWFRPISGKGSSYIRRHVFQRLLNYEAKKVRDGEDPDDLITQQNYSLQVSGRESINGSDCLVVRAVPRHISRDLFDGNIWIDSQDFAIVRISGRLAKSPSFWIKEVNFQRDYRKVNGFWLPSREEAASSVRIFGTETLTVDFMQYKVLGTETELPVSGGVNTVCAEAKCRFRNRWSLHGGGASSLR